MSLKSFIRNIGFEIDPFLYTNADKEEEYLDKYFVESDYFEDIWGDPDLPTSSILYAPRGGGKSACRLMIEKRATEINNGSLLTINYTDHDLTSFGSIKEISLSYHLEYINRLLLLSLLNIIHQSPDNLFQNSYKNSERQYIFKLCKIYLFNTPSSFPNQAINSLKTLGDKFGDFWENFKGPIGELVKMIGKIFGAEFDLSKIKVEKELRSSHKNNFLNLKGLLKKVGINTIYILVDKVDEQQFTGNDKKASFRFISPILKDLTLLEEKGIAFKFFLWDELMPYCSKVARSDRIDSFMYTWDHNSLEELLNKRLKVFSTGNIDDASKLFESEILPITTSKINIWSVGVLAEQSDQKSKNLGRSIIFAEHSPRDLIRICKRAVSEQHKANKKLNYVSRVVLNHSIDIFCEEKSLELLKGSLKDIQRLKKINSASFIIEEVLKTVKTEEKRKLETFFEKLKSLGLITIVNNTIEVHGRTYAEYAFTDIRIARVACSSMSLEAFLTKKVRSCRTVYCQKMEYRNFEKKLYRCTECGSLLNPDKADTGISDKKVQPSRNEKLSVEDGFEERVKFAKRDNSVVPKSKGDTDRLDDK